MHPRMQSISGGAIVSIQFGDAVALCARSGYRLSPLHLDLKSTCPLDSDYRDRLELKSATDRTLGVGVTESENTLLVLTSGTMIKVQMDTENISSFDPEYVSGICVCL
jgi:nuclear pore complex protein Nup133